MTWLHLLPNPHMLPRSGDGKLWHFSIPLIINISTQSLFTENINGEKLSLGMTHVSSSSLNTCCSKLPLSSEMFWLCFGGGFTSSLIIHGQEDKKMSRRCYLSAVAQPPEISDGAWVAGQDHGCDVHLLVPYDHEGSEKLNMLHWT